MSPTEPSGPIDPSNPADSSGPADSNSALAATGSAIGGPIGLALGLLLLGALAFVILRRRTAR